MGLLTTRSGREPGRRRAGRGLSRRAAALAGPRGKWVVLAAWIAIAAAAGQFAGKLAGAQTNEPSAYLPKSAESTQALELSRRFPGGELTPAVVVYRRASGLTAHDRARVAADRQALLGAHVRGAVQVTRPLPSRDGTALLFSVVLSVDGHDKALNDAVSAIRRVVGAGGGGLEAAVTGPAGFSYDAGQVFDGLDSTLLLATGGLVAVLLLLIYRSPLLWLLPLLAVGLGEVATRAAAYGLAEAGLTVSGQTAGILTVLVFGAGTDYALLIVARYREELCRHADHHDAIAAALRRAAPAILASAGTVICALVCLLLAELSSNRGVGPIAAAGIAIVLVAMLTALPALLAVVGRRAFWPFIPHVGDDPHEGTGLWARIGRRIEPRPRRVWVLTAIVLAVLAAGLTQLELGLPQARGFRGDVEAVRGQELLSASFPAGSSAPADVIVRDASRVGEVRRAAASTAGVVRLGPVQRAGALARFDAVLAASPYTPAGQDAVRALRARVGPGVLVGGPTAQTLDANASATRDTVVIVPIVLVVVLIVLGLLLRAVVVPLLLVATVVLSFAAALGFSVFLFQHVLGFAGLESSLILLSFVFLVALGVDYNIFLMARVREEAARHGTRPGVLRGLAVTGSVITSAGVVLAGTFSVLAVLPLVALTEIGFIVAFGVLLDTLVVRSVLVPALALDVGPRLWWPSRLARREQS